MILTAPTRCPAGWGLYVRWLQANELVKTALAGDQLSEPVEIAASRTLAYKEALNAYCKHMHACPECKNYILRLEQINGNK
jgi:hypothetical protein